MSIFRKKKRVFVGERYPDSWPDDLRIVELRPCIVGGRRAIFHRWVNSAHPVPPKGMEINESTRYFQFRRTDGLVEFEDGSIERVYPNEILFVDGGAFDLFDWSKAGGGSNGQA